MAKSKSAKTNRSESKATADRKLVPINHVILKRINDVRDIVSDLADSPASDTEGLALDNTAIAEQLLDQTTELEALRHQIQDLQDGLLSSICSAMDERLNSATVDALPHEAAGPESSLETPKPPTNKTPTNKAVAADSEQGVGDNTWASIRSAFLSEHNVNTEAASQTDGDTIRQADSSDQDEQSDGTEEQLESCDEVETDSDTHSLVDLTSVTVAADLESLEPVELRETIGHQEQVISELLRKLQQKQSSRPSMTNDQLSDIQQLDSTELSEEIRHTLDVLQDQQRQGQLELSLERARLSRRCTVLEQLEERLEGRARTLGVTINEDGTIDDIAPVERPLGTKSRRWLSALGFAKN